MSAHALATTFAGLTTALSNCARPAPSINIAPSLADFANQSADCTAKLGRAADSIVRAAYGGQRYAAMMNPAEFAALKAFVQYLDGEFALLGAGFRRDDKPDEQHSPDGYSHHLDREKL